MNTETRKIKLLVEVEAPAKLSKKKVADLVSRLINTGLEDAQNSEDIGSDDPDILLVQRLSIKHPKPVKETTA